LAPLALLEWGFELGSNNNTMEITVVGIDIAGKITMEGHVIKGKSQIGQHPCVKIKLARVNQTLYLQPLQVEPKGHGALVKKCQ
jgi:hypothetical protein